MNRTKLILVAKTIGPWIPAILLTLVFARQGWSKFDDASGWSFAFRTWGYPDWFRVSVGVAEVGAVALLLLGRTAALGALLIIGVMFGGMSTHLHFDQGRHMTSEIVPIVLASIVLVARRDQVRALASRLNMKPAVALAAAIVLLMLGAAVTPRLVAAQAVPQKATLAQFKKLQWLVGTWRGSGGGLTGFYEEYRVVDDSTLGVRSFVDSTLKVVSDSQTIQLRGGQVQRRSIRSLAFAVTLTDTTVRFLRQGAQTGGFKFARGLPNEWTATLYPNSANGRETIYTMRRYDP
jgi:putative oxidoreductase